VAKSVFLGLGLVKMSDKDIGKVAVLTSLKTKYMLDGMKSDMEC